jgi:hypothetical protein
LPYFERVVPTTFLFGVTVSLVALVAFLGELVRNAASLALWCSPMYVLLALAVVSTWRGWPWPVRLLLHAAWVLAQVLLVVLFLKGVLVVQFR